MEALHEHQFKSYERTTEQQSKVKNAVLFVGKVVAGAIIAGAALSPFVLLWSEMSDQPQTEVPQDIFGPLLEGQL